jgi:septal ring factor EnvC (AmiA/AmiB activator)
MTRIWKLCGLPTLAALLLAAHAAAGGPGAKDGAGETDPVKKLEKVVEALDQKFAGQLKSMADQVSQGFKKLHDRLKAIEENEADTRLKLPEVESKLKSLEKVFNQLREDIEALQKRLPAGDISKYPPAEKTTLDDVLNRLRRVEQELGRLQMQPGAERTARSAPTTGRIVFENRHREYLLFILNRKAYRVEAGQVATIDAQPAGSFTYEVISPSTGSGGIHTRVLAPGETFTITAR